MPAKIIEIAVAFWITLGEMAPYLLFGFLMAGVLSVLISPELIERHLGGSGFGSIFKASIFGIPLPLCSCSVIPVAASLRKHGAGKSATVAFLLSTPQTGADSIMATLGLLGPVFALFRPLAALASGLLGGLAVKSLDNAPGMPEEEHEACQATCCEHENGQSKAIRLLRYGFITLPQDIAKPLIIGLIIAAGISALTPHHFFASFLGTGLLSMLAMMVAGIPVYVCATASIPIAAAMMLRGITPGAALVFLMTGPATNAATVATLWKTLGKKTTVIYLGIVAGTALGSGLLLNLLFDVTGIQPGMPQMEMMPEWFKTVCALTLIIILAVPVLPHPNIQKHKCDEC